MKLCIFEDEKSKDLFPLTMTRATFELRCGHTTLLQKVLRNFQGVGIIYFIRDYLAPTFAKRTNAEAVNDVNALKADDFLFINGRWLFSREELPPESEEEVGICEDAIVYAQVKREDINKNLTKNFNKFLANIRRDITTRELKARLISYPWDLIHNNQRAISEDFKTLRGKTTRRLSSEVIVLGEEKDIFVAKTAEIQPFVVLDATHGPIIIDEDVKIFPFSRIEGPCCIGRSTWITRGNIHKGTSIGPVCRVGGEVEASIIHGYTNKRHLGFLGESYVGEWVNLAAMTTNSDLKNDYSQVQVFVNGKPVNTREMKVGCFIGDHTKTSIGCLLNTGTIIGVMSNVLASGEPLPKFIPSFCWYFRGRFSKGQGLRRMIDTARVVMDRRGVTMTAEDIELLHKLYDMTREERETLMKKSRIKLRRG